MILTQCRVLAAIKHWWDGSLLLKRSVKRSIGNEHRNYQDDSKNKWLAFKEQQIVI